MAVVIPVDKLKKSLADIMMTETITVRLRNTNTAYRDKVTGWTIRGTQIKELPSILPGRPLSQSLFAAVRAGRFVRVIVQEDSVGRKRKKYVDVLDSVMAEYDPVELSEEGITSG